MRLEGEGRCHGACFLLLNLLHLQPLWLSTALPLVHRPVNHLSYAGHSQLPLNSASLLSKVHFDQPVSPWPWPALSLLLMTENAPLANLSFGLCLPPTFSLIHSPQGSQKDLCKCQLLDCSAKNHVRAFHPIPMPVLAAPGGPALLPPACHTTSQVPATPKTTFPPLLAALPSSNLSSSFRAQRSHNVVWLFLESSSFYSCSQLKCPLLREVFSDFLDWMVCLFLPSYHLFFHFS